MTLSRIKNIYFQVIWKLCQRPSLWKVEKDANGHPRKAQHYHRVALCATQQAKRRERGDIVFESVAVLLSTEYTSKKVISPDTP
jgi:hypothetical protein